MSSYFYFIGLFLPFQDMQIQNGAIVQAVTKDSFVMQSY